VSGVIDDYIQSVCMHEKNQQPITDLTYWNGCISDQSWQNVQTAILVYGR